ncbi:hypothetical protein HAX54_034038 [Datura stramonium]|uniref:Uncharacterized protein n=1 Tax=Datura stramonium TaxID=4076 RepID=A0ABS8VH35_DATST|nr:hypothetical protein [Datura stramonium]
MGHQKNATAEPYERPVRLPLSIETGYSAYSPSDVWGSVSDQGVVIISREETLAESSLLLMGGSVISYGHRHPSQGLAQDPTTRRIWFAWQGNFESWVQDPLSMCTIAHAIWGSSLWSTGRGSFYFEGGALGPVNIAYSGVYQWWYTIGLRTNEDLYTGALFLLFLSAISLIAGWLRPTTEMETERFLVQKCRISSESSFVRLFGVSSLA